MTADPEVVAEELRQQRADHVLEAMYARRKQALADAREHVDALIAGMEGEIGIAPSTRLDLEQKVATWLLGEGARPTVVSASGGATISYPPGARGSGGGAGFGSSNVGGGGSGGGSH